MYAHMNHTMIHALDAARRAAAQKATPRPARAAPASAAMRHAVGKILVKAGTRLAPDTARPTPAVGTPC